jgi:hypothetical protein
MIKHKQNLLGTNKQKIEPTKQKQTLNKPWENQSKHTMLSVKKEKKGDSI